MASMTTEFYKMKLYNTGDEDNELNYRFIQNILTNIFEAHAVDNGQYRSIDLSPRIEPTSVTPKETMDLFHDDNYLFGRIGRKKANNAMVKRDYNTLRAQTVFDPNEVNSQGIELFTFFILDYQQGILSVVNTKGAPNINAFKALCENYSPDYSVEFDSIPNREGINLLYGSNAPEISKIEFELPVPNAEFLQGVLGLDEPEIADMIRESLYSTTIILKPMNRQKLVSVRERVCAILDILGRNKNNYTKAIVRGNAEGFKSRNFDLHARYFTYPIEINRYRIRGGVKVEYSLNELVEQYRYGLHMAYENNYDIINAIAGR